MNYLELVNDFLTESSMEDPLGTVQGQIDDGLKAVTWIRAAWLRIQRERKDWKFMWAEGSFNTVAGQSVYTKAEQNLAGRRKNDSLHILAEKRNLVPVSTSSLRYKTGDGLPSQFGVKPDESIILHYTPDAVYTVDYEYYRTPVVLTDDEDVPALPEEFHKLIVMMALEDYAREQGKEWNGLYRASGIDIVETWQQLINDQTPEWGGKVGIE